MPGTMTQPFVTLKKRQSASFARLPVGGKIDFQKHLQA
jgi:hypothetical protein